MIRRSIDAASSQRWLRDSATHRLAFRSSAVPGRWGRRRSCDRRWQRPSCPAIMQAPTSRPPRLGLAGGAMGRGPRLPATALVPRSSRSTDPEGHRLGRGRQAALGRGQGWGASAPRRPARLRGVACPAGPEREPYRALRADPRAPLVYAEMRDAFGSASINSSTSGGYPGQAYLVLMTSSAGPLILFDRRPDHDLPRPAAADPGRQAGPLRSLFRLVCDYSGQIVSYQKLTGQLQDAVIRPPWPTTSIYSAPPAWRRAREVLGGKGPQAGCYFEAARPRHGARLRDLRPHLRESRQDSEHWGRLVETAVGLPTSTRLATPGPRSSTGETAARRSTS